MVFISGSYCIASLYKDDDDDNNNDNNNNNSPGGIEIPGWRPAGDSRVL